MIGLVRRCEFALHKWLTHISKLLHTLATIHINNGVYSCNMQKKLKIGQLNVPVMLKT